MQKQRNSVSTTVGLPREDSTRGRILGAAERLFAEHGFNSVSMPAIATASGITAGAIYKHFDSKSDLFFEVIKHTVQSTPVPSPENIADVMYLPNVVATYSTSGLKLLRQLAVEIHSASARHARVRRLLRRSLDVQIAQIAEVIAAAQKAGNVDPALDGELLASAVLVFTMGMMHMDTLVPRLIDDVAWHDFVRDRVAALLGVRA